MREVDPEIVDDVDYMVKIWRDGLMKVRMERKEREFGERMKSSGESEK